MAILKYKDTDGTYKELKFLNTVNVSEQIGVATQTDNGLMSSADKTKLDGVATNANNYVHPTTAGNKHIPSGGSAGQILKYDSAGTAVWSSDIINVETTTKSVSVSGVTLAFTFRKFLRFIDVFVTISWNNTASASFDNEIGIPNNFMPFGDTIIDNNIPLEREFYIDPWGKIHGYLDDMFGSGAHSYVGHTCYMSKE